MVLYGEGADVERSSDLQVGLAPAYRFQDLQLAAAQVEHIAALARRGPCVEQLEGGHFAERRIDLRHQRLEQAGEAQDAAALGERSAGEGDEKALVARALVVD